MTVFLENKFEILVREHYYDIFNFYKDTICAGRSKNKLHQLLCLDTAKRFADHHFEVEFNVIVTKYPFTRADLKVTKENDWMYVLIESFCGNHCCRRILQRSLHISKYGLVAVVVPEKVFVNDSEAKHVNNLSSVLSDYGIGFLIAPYHIDSSIESIKAKIPGVYGQDYTLCPIPGCKDREKPFLSLGFHLKKTHNISPTECKKLYPDTIMVAKKSHDLFSKSRKMVIQREREIMFH